MDPLPRTTLLDQVLIAGRSMKSELEKTRGEGRRRSESVAEAAAKASLNQRRRKCATLPNPYAIAGDLCGCRVFPDLLRVERDGFAATYRMRSDDTLVVP